MARNTQTAEFASRLRAIMAARGFTARETARRMREHLPAGTTVSLATISHYRTGRVIPRSPKLDALSLALGVEPWELVEGDPERAGAPVRGTRFGREWSPAGDGSGPIGIQDLGDAVHLRIDQRVSWDVALKILDALKRKAE